MQTFETKQFGCCFKILKPLLEDIELNTDQYNQTNAKTTIVARYVNRYNTLTGTIDCLPSKSKICH